MSLRVVLLTRSSRPSGAQMAWRLFQAGVPPVAVIVEKRGRMFRGIFLKKRGQALKGQSPFSLLANFGFDFICKKVSEAFSVKAHYLLRCLLGKKFKSPVYLSIEELALDYPVPIYGVEDHNGKEAAEILQKIRPDIGILTNTRRIKKEILEIPKEGFLNLHLSDLPRYG